MKVGAYRNTREVRPAAASHPMAGTAKAPAPEPPREIDDSAEIFGVPEAELTPRVRSAMMKLMAEVEALRQELAQSKRRVGELEKIADQDPLAPVANRRAFVRELTKMISYSDRYGVPNSLVFFDVNGMKQINDTYGHTAGDQALLKVANALLDHTRETDVVGRLGGDEFAIILAQAGNDKARAKADELVEAIRSEPLVLDGNEVTVDVAHGIFPFRPGEDATTTLAEADRRMYEKKRQMKADAA